MRRQALQAELDVRLAEVRQFPDVQQAAVKLELQAVGHATVDRAPLVAVRVAVPRVLRVEDLGQRVQREKLLLALRVQSVSRLALRARLESQVPQRLAARPVLPPVALQQVRRVQRALPEDAPQAEAWKLLGGAQQREPEQRVPLALLQQVLMEQQGARAFAAPLSLQLPSPRARILRVLRRPLRTSAARELSAQRLQGWNWSAFFSRLRQIPAEDQ